MRKWPADALAAAIGFAVLIALVLVRASGPGTAVSVPSTYDTGPNGYAALYDLLARERITVSRFELPVAQIPARDGVLLVAGDGALDAIAPSSTALEALAAWVRGGKTILIAGAMSEAARDAFGVPAPSSMKADLGQARTACAFAGAMRGLRVSGSFESGFAPGCRPGRAALLRAGALAPAIALAIGRGTLVAVTTASALDNRHLWQQRNAAFAYAMFAQRGSVAFDERPYGYAAGRSFLSVLAWPVRAALALTVLALLLALAGANVPFAPPYAPAAAGERDSGAYIVSVAQLLQRAGASREIVERIAAESERLLEKRRNADERAIRLLDRARSLRALSNPTPNDVLAAGELFAAVRKEYDW